MNTSIPYKKRIMKYLEQVGGLGANNAQIKKATGIPSHQQVYLLTQELAGKSIIAARKKGNTWFFTLPDHPSPDSFQGEWLVISSPDFDQEYLETITIPYVKIRVDKYGFTGTFQIGLIDGDFTGRLDGQRVLFSFEAMDEMDPVHGAGTISLQEEHMIFKLMYYTGNEWTFICKRNITPKEDKL